MLVKKSEAVKRTPPVMIRARRFHTSPSIQEQANLGISKVEVSANKRKRNFTHAKDEFVEKFDEEINHLRECC
jgi:hypothetical protein